MSDEQWAGQGYPPTQPNVPPPGYQPTQPYLPPPPPGYQQPYLPPAGVPPTQPYPPPPGYQPTQPYLPPPPGYPPPKRTRHIARNVLLGLVGFVVLITIISVAAGGGTKPKKDAAATATTHPAAPPSTANSPAVKTTRAAKAPAKRTAAAHATHTSAGHATHTTAAAPGNAGVPKTWVMPDEVGKVLQDAQDDVQRASGDPIFFSHSQDATGQERFQVLDRDWKVCAQNVIPGRKVAWDGHVVFSVVKLDESCP